MGTPVEVARAVVFLAFYATGARTRRERRRLTALTLSAGKR